MDVAKIETKENNINYKSPSMLQATKLAEEKNKAEVAKALEQAEKRRKRAESRAPQSELAPSLAQEPHQITATDLNVASGIDLEKGSGRNLEEASGGEVEGKSGLVKAPVDDGSSLASSDSFWYEQAPIHPQQEPVCPERQETEDFVQQGVRGRGWCKRGRDREEEGKNKDVKKLRKELDVLQLEMDKLEGGKDKKGKGKKLAGKDDRKRRRKGKGKEVKKKRSTDPEGSDNQDYGHASSSSDGDSFDASVSLMATKRKGDKQKPLALAFKSISGFDLPNLPIQWEKNFRRMKYYVPLTVFNASNIDAYWATSKQNWTQAKKPRRGNRGRSNFSKTFYPQNLSNTNSTQRKEAGGSKEWVARGQQHTNSVALGSGGPAKKGPKGSGNVERLVNKSLTSVQLPIKTPEDVLVFEESTSKPLLRRKVNLSEMS
ncbi:uncharacterized protein MELLADRAFT_103746 [Melampsora larici-populina 98AG31]|uniref:Uncharacterized protein n=1 Tax=Melampsora larici-populina (strain 98AG31 / pathotype 3-4-7) TaxID=747676 RepID=F4RC86_MELLP|nr:uncharacterized protein MELLADRAFT_103746 [Melampsora larici-populina 98AG31]EGG09996.1 hypothetical protein MELLADRAFT_103746 [Melampsora larici-populina 98AG31]